MTERLKTAEHGLPPRVAHGRLSKDMRVARVAALVMEGLSLREIREVTGHDTATIRKYRDEGLELYRRDAEQARLVWTARSERLFGRVWPRALEGDDRAIDHVIKLMNAAGRYWRFDQPAPAQKNVVTQNNLFVLAGSDTELANLSLAELRALAAAEMERKAIEAPIEGEVIDGSDGDDD